LQEDIDTRTQALRTCGIEIVDLRRAVQKKDQVIQNLQMKVNNYEVLERRQQEELQICLEGNCLTTSNMPLLAQHYTKLQTKYTELDQSHREMTQKLLSCRNYEAELIEFKAKYKEMEAAHVAQAAYLQKAQREMQKIGVYKQTIGTQETVIAKLEKLVDAKLAEAKANAIGPNVHAEIFRLRLENAFLKEQTTCHIASARLNQPTLSPKAPTPVPPLRVPRQTNGEASGNGDRPATKASLPPLRVEKATNTEPSLVASLPRLSSPTTHDDVLVVRVRVLEEQLRVIATNAAQEIAQLKAALFEHEMGTVW
ncbi:hypothetical protein ACHHYP_15766, partial [Achlya hypogyna]